MPFKSEAQRRYLWANEPEIARDWTDTYGSKIQAADGGIMRLGLRRGGPGPGGISKPSWSPWLRCRSIWARGEPWRPHSCPK